MFILGPTLIAVCGFIVFGFVLSRLFKRNDVADFLWGLGFIALAAIHALYVQDLSFRAGVVIVMVLAWGLRLSLHLGLRVFGQKNEDPRYAEWRRTWGKAEPLRAFVKVYLLQGTMLGVIGLPIAWIIHSRDTTVTVWDFLGLLVFLFGLIWESIADLQLAEFKKDPSRRGRVLREGVWKYSRHPNYFGEILVWWGIFLVGMSIPGSIWTITSPLLISFLLLRVSGVPMLEKAMKEKGAEFSAYLESTSAVIPFQGRDIFAIVLVALALLFFDFLWLGLAMSRFYQEEAAALIRVVNGQWTIVPWATVGVYFFIALGIRVFATRPSLPETIWRGALFGLCTYAIYDFTNLALIKGWPWKMALVDIAWGPVLCAAGAAVSFVVNFRLGSHGK